MNMDTLSAFSSPGASGYLPNEVQCLEGERALQEMMDEQTTDQPQGQSVGTSSKDANNSSTDSAPICARCKKTLIENEDTYGKRPKFWKNCKVCRHKVTSQKRRRRESKAETCKKKELTVLSGTKRSTQPQGMKTLNFPAVPCNTSKWLSASAQSVRTHSQCKTFLVFLVVHTRPKSVNSASWNG
jgi:hypothetical protein